MAARSVAGTVAGEPANKLRRRSAGSRVDKSMADSLGSVVQGAKESDRAYLKAEIEAAPEEDVTTLAVLWRSGAIQRALRLRLLQDGADDVKGSLIAVGTNSFKALTVGELNAHLTSWHADVFTEEVLWQLKKDEKKNLVTYGLGLGQGALLPKHEDVDFQRTCL